MERQHYRPYDSADVYCSGGTETNGLAEQLEEYCRSSPQTLTIIVKVLGIIISFERNVH